MILHDKQTLHDADSMVSESADTERGGDRAGGIQVVDRVAQVLELFSTGNLSLRPTDVAEQLGLQRTTGHRYLASMEKSGILARNDDGSFGLGPLLVQVGALAIGERSPLYLARPLMRDLSASTRQTAVLSLWGSRGPVVVHVEEDRTREVRISVNVGYALRLDTAQAMTFLAFHPDPVTVRNLVGQLPEAAAVEVTEQMKFARANKIVVKTSDSQGIRAIAAPVFGDEEIAAVLALVGTTTGIETEIQSHQARALAEAAAELTRALQVVTRHQTTAVGGKAKGS